MVPDWAGYCLWRDTFAQVIDDRLYTMDWLDSRILSGDAHIWLTENAAIVAELRHYPTGAKDIHGLIAAGDLRDIVGTLIPAAEEFGRSVGCVGAVIESRAGWTRALKECGYELYQTSVRKELN